MWPTTKYMLLPHDHTELIWQVQDIAQAKMAATRLFVWTCVDCAVHHHGLYWVASLDPRWLGRTAWTPQPLDTTACLQSVLESPVLPQTRHVSGPF